MPKDGPRFAVRRMKEENISSIYIVDSSRRFLGIVKIDDAMELVRRDKHDITEVIVNDVPVTSPDTSILDLLPTAFSAKSPIVVLDDNRTMLGIISRASVISSIVGEESK